MKVVILAGGLGTILSKETTVKPMVEEDVLKKSIKQNFVSI